ncbi:hypothetical protein [Nocardia abscessus]|uniref:hypothetical protein n=1 Tax=Nocardia abscessus TaxID=120957 RepID=UPI002453AE7B|nr:hypothetical protein [Nocardia abscessus]
MTIRFDVPEECAATVRDEIELLLYGMEPLTKWLTERGGGMQVAVSEHAAALHRP